MAKFGSIEEFRAALNNLVNNTGRSNPKPKRTKFLSQKQVRSSLWPEDSAQARMRTNMAIRVPFGGKEVVFEGSNAPQEAAAFMREMGLAGGAAPAAQPAAQPAPRGAMAGRPAMGAAVRGSKSSSGSGKWWSIPGVPEDEWQYKSVYAAIAAMLGFQKEYCPGILAAAPGKKRPTNQQALRSMGLEPDDAIKFRSAMYQKFPALHGPVFDRHGNPLFDRKTGKQKMGFQSKAVTPAVKAAAYDLINSMGITCPVVNRDLSGLGDIEAANNPRRRRRRARARRNVGIESAAPWIGVRETADSEIYKGFRSKKAATKFAAGGLVFEGPFDMGGDHYLGVGDDIEMPFERHYRAAANPRFW